MTAPAPARRRSQVSTECLSDISLAKTVNVSKNISFSFQSAYNMIFTHCQNAVFLIYYYIMMRFFIMLCCALFITTQNTNALMCFAFL